MPYKASLQEVLQAARQQLKAVVETRQCEGIPGKQWSRCSRPDLLEVCISAERDVTFCSFCRFALSRFYVLFLLVALPRPILRIQ